MNEKKISISAGNSKMGAIPSVSLPAWTTCPKNAPCFRECYAAKISRLRPSVRMAYERNLEILQSDPDLYFAQVEMQARISSFFRWHVSGDIPNEKYFSEMVRIARAVPGCRFLCFTKKAEIVNAFIDGGGEIPENLKVIFSVWREWRKPNPHNLPECAVIFPDDDLPNGWKVCGGNCTECACRGVGCWEIKNGETIAIYKH